MVSADDFPEPSEQSAGPAAPAEDDATRIVPAQPGATAHPAPGAARGGGRLHLAPGQLLAHTYEIEALLGRCGMGEVYRARHIKLQSLHAIKVIAPELVNDARVVEMFTEEARKLRLVRDDAVVSYDGLIGDEDGLLYLIMEFVDGVSLATIIRERKLSPNELRRLRDRLAQGLSAAHDKLIYHRDISPDNIILVDGNVDQAKIIDFGIAKSAAAGDRTVIGNDFAGKYSYVSPEQLGMFGGNVDGRSDIYSLGLVIAAAGLGHSLDMGNSPATAVEARRHVPDLTPLPDDLCAELTPLLEPNPADRPRSMRELPGGDGDAPVGKVTPRAAPTRSTAPPAAAAPRSRLPLFLGGGVAVLAAIAVGLYLQIPGALPSPSPAARNTTPSAPVSPPPVSPPSVASLPPPAIDAAALSSRVASIARSLRCADLKPEFVNLTEPGLGGFVTSESDQSRLGQMLDDVPSLQRAAKTVGIRPWPQCDQVLKLVGDAGALDDAAAAPRLDFNVPSLDYRLGDKLVLKVTGSATSDGFLYVDFLDSAGNIAHLFPRPNGPSNAVRAGQTITLGESKDSILEIAEPIGPNLVLAIFSPQRLFAARADEAAQTYLPALSRSLAAPARPKAAYAFVNALAR